MQDAPLIFLSYSSPDRDRVFAWHDWLSGKGFDTWMDKRRIKGGQNWDFEIKRALQKAAIVIVFLSANSVDRRGYAQREIRSALDHSRDKLIDDIYLIPVMLDEVPIPPELESIHIIRPADGDAFELVADAITAQLERLGAEIARIQGESELRWSMTTHRDSWDGLPGYETSFELPYFQSEVYPQINEITQRLKGWLVGQTMQQRLVKFEQSPAVHNFGQSRFFRKNTWDASCGEPKLKERVLTVAYTVWWYYAGAAHPNSCFRTFSFMLDPLIELGSAASLFVDASKALPVIQHSVRAHFLSNKTDENERSGCNEFSREWVIRGTEGWEDFQNFVFSESGIEFLFPPYAIASYAEGPQTALVPYGSLTKLLHPHIVSALGVEYLDYLPPDWPFPSDEGQSEPVEPAKA
ncbi:MULTISPECIES: TIR domain-containing protein [unclassified Sphingobium]|uniref:TIR domain-containing protein n=1 Tax=unclassified Sphingobium TaxID=2611147 RepID=UPI00222468DD|nr:MULTISPECIES: TIR domain-containing protein [unclassified Sphingobium]MCW2410861.1 hypothetical protein [Sphingobium sp. B8D3D]MCW2416849.1 hypothetical protein [Sphingobium sp. B8D3A]